MTYCNEKQMPCEWAQIGGRCSVSACRKVLLTAGGWPMPTKQPEFVKPPMTNADRIRAMSDEEMAQLLYSIAYARETPWSKPFYEKFCKDCPAPEYTLDDGRKLCLHECDFKNGKCPHGTDIVWWLKQPAEEVHHV